MDENQLQRNLKESMRDLIKFLGDQGTTQPEFTVAKIALEHRMQKRLIRPTWVLTLATIGTLIIAIIQMMRLEDRVNNVENELQKVMANTGSVVDK